MKSRVIRAVLGFLLLFPVAASAFSRSIDRDIEFPKGYDPKKAEAIRKVIRDERFNFVSGNVSYWPPDWGTRLSYEGDAASFNLFVTELRDLQGIALRLVLYKGRNDERRHDSSWQLDYSHARPDELTIYLNVNSRTLDFSKVELPPWPAKPRE